MRPYKYVKFCLCSLITFMWVTNLERTGTYKLLQSSGGWFRVLTGFCSTYCVTDIVISCIMPTKADQIIIIKLHHSGPIISSRPASND